MKEMVAVATVEGKAYFLIVNALREQNIPFMSIIPGEPILTRVKLVITTEKEKDLVNYDKIFVFHDENDLENLISDIQRILLGKELYDKIVIGIDPGEAIGLAVLADGKVIGENNCFSTYELSQSVLKSIKNISFADTHVLVKIGNGTPIYRELLENLDDTLPIQVELEVVSEAGTDKPQKRHTRKIRHISSAIRIAGRSGCIIRRKKSTADIQPQ
jgi:hypothetical protein